MFLILRQHIQHIQCSGRGKQQQQDQLSTSTPMHNLSQPVGRRWNNLLQSSQSIRGITKVISRGAAAFSTARGGHYHTPRCKAFCENLYYYQQEQHSRPTAAGTHRFGYSRAKGSKVAAYNTPSAKPM
ncbi:hypothetical protein Nepgr_023049 [Nepenthes gracilis]|uniref:Uncharacterized protein n=1 Tax=Nepenthes gracilis TaxID=150966 RepID=A0AAD3XXD1_NEPGR|nr:hypothetical protein Nepgr_023049 [Nepenthes gracilis]